MDCLIQRLQMHAKEIVRTLYSIIFYTNLNLEVYSFNNIFLFSFDTG